MPGYAAAVTYHRAQQFVNKSKLLPWGRRAMLFVFKDLCRVPFLCCALVVQAFSQRHLLRLFTPPAVPSTRTPAGKMQLLIRLPPLTGWMPLGAVHLHGQGSVLGTAHRSGLRSGMQSPNWGFTLCWKKDGALSGQLPPST